MQFIYGSLCSTSYVYVHLASMFNYFYDKLPAAFFDPVPLGTHGILLKFKRPIALFCFVHPPRGAPLNRPSAVFSTSASSLTILGGGQLKTATHDKSISPFNVTVNVNLAGLLSCQIVSGSWWNQMRPREDQTPGGRRDQLENMCRVSRDIVRYSWFAANVHRTSKKNAIESHLEQWSLMHFWNCILLCSSLSLSRHFSWFFFIQWLPESPTLLAFSSRSYLGRRGVRNFGKVALESSRFGSKHTLVCKIALGCCVLLCLLGTTMCCLDTSRTGTHNHILSAGCWKHMGRNAGTGWSGDIWRVVI